MRSRIACLVLAALGAATALPAPAQESVSGLPEVRPGRTSDFERVPQDADEAAGIAATLRRIRLPDGFSISLYALVPGARHIAVGPEAGTVFVGTRGARVWAVRDQDGDGTADDVRSFAPSLRLAMPNGVCVAADGTLYVAEQNRVLAFPGAEQAVETPTPRAFAVVQEGELIPRRYESRGHSARVCEIGPDGLLYISLGQPHNVAPKSRLAAYDEWGIGGIIRIRRDGTGREVYTYGIRNSVGHAHNPANGELWFTDNQVDGMGDDIPPGELNRQTAPGQHFGFPWYGGGRVLTDAYRNDPPPDGVIFPEVEFTAHAADLGMMFYTGTAFPERYRGGIFSAQHGSWNRTVPTGAQVMFTAVLPDGSAGESGVFATGWIAADGSYLGRPVAVAQFADGSILVSDDHAGALYRIAYGE